MLGTIIMILSCLLVIVAGVTIIECCGGDWTEPQCMINAEILFSIMGVLIILGGVAMFLEVIGVFE